MARRRTRKSNRTGTTITAIALTVIALAAMGGIGYVLWLRSQVSEIDEATLCPGDGPAAHLAILVDTTDPLSLTQAEAARQHIEDKIDDARVGTRISFSTVNPDGETRQTAFFSMCKPASREEAKQLYENPRLIEKRFQTAFAEPVQQVLDALLRVPEAPASPIMESAQEFAIRIPGFATDDVPREFVLMSDLVQHSDAFSFFRGGDWASFSAAGGPDRFGSTFDGATVQVLRIPRLTERRNVIDDFWVRYFDAQGFDSVRVLTIGDL